MMTLLTQIDKNYQNHQKNDKLTDIKNNACFSGFDALGGSYTGGV